MTPEERAVKVYTDTLIGPMIHWDAVKLAIAAQIREAVEEALKDFEGLNRGLWQIKMAQAYADAAKIADSQMPSDAYVDKISGCKSRIAELILERAKEVSGK